MKNALVSITISLAVTLAGIPSIGAAPLQGAGLAGAGTTETSPIDEARWFCVNRASGRFLHWGRCGRPTYRVYCRNRFTGRFLHWGYC